MKKKEREKINRGVVSGTILKKRMKVSSKYGKIKEREGERETEVTL